MKKGEDAAGIPFCQLNTREMKSQNGRCAFLQAGMDQNGLGERDAEEPSKKKTKRANLTRAGKGLDQISKPLPVTHRTDREKIGQHFSLADERAEHRRTNKSAGRSEPGRAAGSKAKRMG
jgi:hypothetical protein